VNLRTSVIVLIHCLLFCFLVPVLAAGDPEQTSLPIYLTDEEKLRLHEIGRGHAPTAAPSGVVRNPGEWEPSEGVLIRWPLGIPVDLIAEMSEDIVVTTIVFDASEESSARSTYTSGGVNMANVAFIHAPTDTIYTRDYGPWFIFEDNQLAISNHIYNRPRPNDDAIPQVVGSEWGLNVYGMDLKHTGGNHMSNGLGLSSSSELVYLENPSMSVAEIHQQMQDYLGNDYTVLDYIQASGIHHIDTYAKFLSPSTVLVKDVPVGDPTKDDLDAHARFLASLISPWGKPYNVVRIFCPSGTYYTNSLILNNKVFIPFFNNAQDSIALQTYQDAMPGYEVTGYNGSWQPEDALHCRTMGVPDRGMLHLNHVPFSTEQIAFGDYEIVSTIKTASGFPLIPESLRIRYTVDGGAWQEESLVADGGTDSFTGYIPAQPEDSVVAYYLQASDDSGRFEKHPYIGRHQPHTFQTSCPAHPLVELTPGADAVACTGTDQLLSVDLTGGTGPFTLQWTEDGVEIPGANSPSYKASNSGNATL
jgi:agmatine deiminase